MPKLGTEAQKIFGIIEALRNFADVDFELAALRVPIVSKDQEEVLWPTCHGSYPGSASWFPSNCLEVVVEKAASDSKR